MENLENTQVQADQQEQVAEQVTEQQQEEVVQQGAEPQQTPKTYSQEEMTAAVEKAVKRNEARLHRQYERRYGPLEQVLKAGTGKQTVEEITETFRSHYAAKGVPMPQETGYSQRDTERLAKADAEEIISGGFEEVVAETDRLSKIGLSKMTPREKQTFNILAAHRNSAERARELSAIGVPEAVANSPEFQEFARKFNRATPVREVYELYRTTTQPKKEVRTVGSMQTVPAKEDGLKDFYTPEEARKFTAQDLRENPELEKRLWASARKWKR